MRKVYLELKVEVIVVVDDGTEMIDVVDCLEVRQRDDRDCGQFDLEDASIVDHKVTDSK